MQELIAKSPGREVLLPQEQSARVSETRRLPPAQTRPPRALARCRSFFSTSMLFGNSKA